MKKIFMIAVMLITSFCVNCFTENDKEKVENVVENMSNEVSIEESIDTENTEFEIAYDTEETISENNEVQSQIASENQVETESSIQVQENTQKENKQVTTPIQSTQNIQTTQEKVNTEVQQNTTQEIQNVSTPDPVTKTETKTLTPDDLEYWCVGGGTHHIAGDGANEHGYYSSWDEAYSAFEQYTSGWSSVQFKVSACSCGLYYFWAIQ
jgi:hypothetical protein